MKLNKIIKIYRISDWIHYLGFFLIGYTVNHTVLTKSFYFHIIEIMLILAYSYSVNQFFDEKMKKKSIIFPIIPLVLSLFFLSFFERYDKFLIISFILLSTAYSLPKIRIKSIPILCSLSNNIGFSILFLLAGPENITMSSTLRLFLLLFFLQSGAQFIHELSHIDDDMKNKIKTTATYFGRGITTKLYYLSMLSSILVSLTFYNDFISLILLTIPTILFSTYFIKNIDLIEISKLRKQYKLSGIVVGGFYLLRNILV